MQVGRALRGQWRTGEERVENLPRCGGYPPEMAVKTAYEQLAMVDWGKAFGLHWEGSASD